MAARDPIVRTRPNPAASLRLFGFPHAGAGASAFRAWAGELGPGVEVCAFQPPGREGRFSERLCARMPALVAAAADAVIPLLDRPFAFFGHSLGSLVAFELCRKLRREGRPLPARLFVSGRRAPQWPFREECFHTMSDADLKEELRRYGGAPAEALDNRELMELMLPILRADFEVHETYTYEDEPPLDLPISALGGAVDPTVPVERLDAWRAQTTAAFNLRMLPGDHFYVNASRGLLLAAIRDDLAPFVR